ncbi:dienelactone hydrolase family protein [Mycobacteroides franklinii]|uniref:Dienelactone hydrolase family protein n=1 Tax=Mycobacteroides franklinii TaxID=948102 RepID=A0A4V3A5J5_9MYCO|nr:dienelactone hydrolase family protein [Mycobacteroides franklinii]ORA57650.1 dienelactone hydrolase [Mycobacteroides franklinii]TDH18115.1 dienelactone hydrolase family protein [Mycobacteroides franklinii]TDZ42881.1 Dienelactone hydrolase family protein [Mycobacteroides franklinii]TDZ50015.1 Dienelactone hydrolase family protein [Mycobacteroides franklinii]TDZ56436.1 Dienelactone hydrolase family protein [Mycobacteroides franklinii]
MTPLQRYIAEEIATDHVEGLLTRREAFRRLALLGVGAAAASALIAACGTDSTPTATPPTSASTSPPPGIDKMVSTEPITWHGPNGTVQGAWASAAQPRGTVLVIHENKGLTDWVRSVAGRLAGVGYSSLAIDLLSEEGGTSTFKDPAEATGALGKITSERFVADLKSGVDEILRRVPDKPAGVVGFCFGGGLVWQLLASGEPRLGAAAPFYGPLPDNPDFSRSKAAVLAFYGELDKRVTASKDQAAEALQRAGLVHEIVVEPGADHAFFNDGGPRYNATAAADAWQRLTVWFGQHVG